ncbi:MAG TPA: RIP metalloprotease RseP [Patescibacteria group bacterium]|jgi:regulator of sigma E protease|nr:RIP metalloprotease RseP [Patescibacteria group bacterium]
MIITILIFLAVLSLLVFVHELGHFVVAKRSGMQVDEFGFGFPPRLFGIQKVGGKWKIVWGRKHSGTEDTVYSINAIPLGGFVKIMGEDNDDGQVDERSFGNKPFWRRFFTLAAGVIMNFILAGVLLSIGYMAGLPIAVEDLSQVPSNATFTEQHVAIIDVVPGSPAEKAGIMPSDIIQSVDGRTFDTAQGLQDYVRANKGKAMEFNVERVNENKTFRVESLAEPKEGEGVVGMGLALYGKLKFSPLPAIGQGFQTAYHQLVNIASGLYHLFASGEGLKSLGGPVKIAQITGQVADLGIIPLLQFAAFLSLNLALLNVLPLPALDGGRILFLLIEKIRGKKNNAKIEQYANAIGFMALLLLMLVITARDVSQLDTIKNLFS